MTEAYMCAIVSEKGNAELQMGFRAATSEKLRRGRAKSLLAMI